MAAYEGNVDRYARLMRLRLWAWPNLLVFFVASIATPCFLAGGRSKLKHPLSASKLEGTPMLLSLEASRKLEKLHAGVCGGGLEWLEDEDSV